MVIPDYIIKLEDEFKNNWKDFIHNREILRVINYDFVTKLKLRDVESNSFLEVFHSLNKLELIIPYEKVETSSHYFNIEVDLKESGEFFNDVLNWFRANNNP